MRAAALERRTTGAETSASSALTIVEQERRRAHRTLFDEEIVGVTAIEVPVSPQPRFGALLKRGIDIAGAGSGLVALAPFLFSVALLVKFSSRGPIFFAQERVGLGGRTFRMWKFRTMVSNAEELKTKLLAQNEVQGAAFKMKRDPRVTKVGRVLRRYSIDELPQLWNVLVGEMSLVGPRPALPIEVAYYRRWQTRRFAAKPGLTCIWQVSGRSTIGFDDWMRMDLRYIENWSLTLDCALLIRTVRAVISADGAY